MYEIRGTDLFPDNRRFGVLWMSRAALGPAFDLDGAFNDVSLRLAPGAVEEEVIARLDRLLEPYGGLGAYGREDQLSHSFLSDEIAQNRVSGTVLPAIFLGVAAFLLNLVLARLVSHAARPDRRAQGLRLRRPQRRPGTTSASRRSPWRSAPPPARRSASGSAG